MSSLNILLPREADGYVYLAKADTGHHKVGRSIDPDKRIKHFDTKMPVDVKEVNYFHADDYVEAEEVLHEICEQHAEHKSGEWWDMPEYLVCWIKNVSYYMDGEFYGSEDYDSTPMEEPSESFANYARLYGPGTDRKCLPSKDAFPSYYPR